MSLLDIIKNKAVIIEKKQNSIFNFPVEKQKKFLEKFPEPKDLVERSFFQYKCQMKLYGRPLSFLLNIMAFPLFIRYLKLKDFLIYANNQFDAVFFSDGKPSSIIPKELFKEFQQLAVINEKLQYFNKKDRHYVFKLWKKHPFSFFFLFKCLIKIRYYSYEINQKKPKAIIVCNEYSFTSSILTDYCHYQNISNINVMHGEKLFFMMDSFFRFDRCYVWDVFYIKLFIKLKASKNQFIVSIPDSLCFSEGKNIVKKYEYKYFLGAENGEQIKKILHIMKKLNEKGKRVAIRLHPRYTDDSELIEKTSCVEVEKHNDLTIENSILETENVISKFSTVLYQAYLNGINIVIDDITDRVMYEKLKELEYLMISKEHLLLSECLS